MADLGHEASRMWAISEILLRVDEEAFLVRHDEVDGTGADERAGAEVPVLRRDGDVRLTVNGVEIGPITRSPN